MDDQHRLNLNAMLVEGRRLAAQQITEAAQTGTELQDAAITLDYLQGRHDAQDFVLEDLEGSHHPDELVSFLDQGLIDYIAAADSLQKVKGFSAVVDEVNDFRLSC